MHRFLLICLLSQGCISFDYGPSPFTCRQSERCPEGFHCLGGRCIADGQPPDLSPSDAHGGTDLDQTTDVTQGDAPWASNRVINPGFEQGAASWVLDQAEVAVGGANGSGHSLHISATGQTQRREGSQIVGKLSPGTYRFEVHVRTELISATGSAQPQAGVEWRDSAGKSLATPTYLHAGQGTSGWKLLSAKTVLAPAGTAQARLMLYVWSEVKSGEVYFDDVLLEPN